MLAVFLSLRVCLRVFMCMYIDTCHINQYKYASVSIQVISINTHMYRGTFTCLPRAVLLA